MGPGGHRAGGGGAPPWTLEEGALWAVGVDRLVAKGYGRDPWRPSGPRAGSLRGRQAAPPPGDPIGSVLCTRPAPFLA